MGAVCGDWRGAWGGREQGESDGAGQGCGNQMEWRAKFGGIAVKRRKKFLGAAAEWEEGDEEDDGGAGLALAAQHGNPESMSPRVRSV